MGLHNAELMYGHCTKVWWLCYTGPTFKFQLDSSRNEGVLHLSYTNVQEAVLGGRCLGQGGIDASNCVSILAYCCLGTECCLLLLGLQDTLESADICMCCLAALAIASTSWLMLMHMWNNHGSRWANNPPGALYVWAQEQGMVRITHSLLLMSSACTSSLDMVHGVH